MDKLLMHIGLIDQVTKPLKGITKQMQSTVDAGRQGMANMAVGGAGLVASGMAIQSALMPAIEMDRKMGEVASLGVTDEALKQLQNTALEFSTEYGKSATDFVGASYDIQSAIAGLDGNELSAFTKSSAILAAATKADTGTITDYMGTMYGIFEESAVSMGKAEWVENMTGMTATAVQMFKTDGTKMAAAFGSLGSSATAMGADVAEQMAVLGTLQATMGGSEAATKYTAFLGGAVKAQDKMGLSFTDSHGRLLPMVDILRKVDGQIGDLGEVAQFEILKDAFGSDEAVKLIQNLLPKTEQLSNSINELGNVQGMGKAEEMAAKMTDQWERMEASFFAVRVAVFGAILPAINAVVGSMVDGMVVVTGWVQEFPILGEILGYVAIGAIALGGVVAALSLAMGIGQMMSAGWALTMGTLNGVFNSLRISTILMTASTWLFNAALAVNPMVWVVASIVALTVAIGAAIYYWDEIKASFADTAVFKFLADTIDWIVDKLNMIPGIDIDVSADMPAVPELASVIKVAPTVETAQLDKMSADMAFNAQRAVPDFSKGWSPEIAVAQQATNSNVIPMLPEAIVANQKWNPSFSSNDDELNTTVAPYKHGLNQTPLSRGMVHNANTVTKHQGGNVRQFGDVHITTTQNFTPDQLAEWEELNVG